jgi:hypothetical protein
METLYRKLMILTLLATGGASFSTAFASDLITESETQRFEQSYEEWATNLVKSISPKLQFTVLTQIELSQNPEKLQSFEDLRAMNHLPGLPDVADPSYSSPFDSPLYSLVEKKNIKIFAQGEVSPNEERVMREILSSKMRLGSGDTLKFETVRAGVSPSHSRKQKNRAGAVAALAGILLLAGAFFYKRKPAFIATAQSVAKTITPPPAPVRAEFSATASRQIMSANDTALRAALNQERVDIIAKASMNASRRFSEKIMGELPQDKFDQVNQWRLRNQRRINIEDSNYARLLFSARIQQVQNEIVLKSIESYGEARHLKSKILESQKILKTSETNEVSA